MIALFGSFPYWVQALLVLAFIGLALVFLLMPFAVFGLKPRMEEVELQLSEIRAELRTLNMRLTRGEGASSPERESDYGTRSAQQNEPAPRRNYEEEDIPLPSRVERILRPSHSEPVLRSDAPAESPVMKPRQNWEPPAHKERTQPRDIGSVPWGSHKAAENRPLESREEMSRRPTAEDERRRREEEDRRNVRPRSEPTLRWPPRP